jgi:hypothetical protein
MHLAEMRLRASLVLWGMVAATFAGPAIAYDWLQFNGDSSHSGNNVLEKSLGAQNAATLTKRYSINLPARAEGAPVFLRGVRRNGVPFDMLFVGTIAGHLLAIDSRTGNVLWSVQHGAGGCTIVSNGNGTCYTTSSPAVDPDRRFVYVYGLDGFVHKHSVVDGTETIVANVWPQLATSKPYDEKNASALATATSAGTSYLYAVNGGYPGDGGDYQGHITAINLANGTQKVFNAACSNVTSHFATAPATPKCTVFRNAIWSRPGVIHDPASNRIFVSTGNGAFSGSAGGFDWSESILALNVDGSGAGGKPVDSYTPSNFQNLDNADADVGSASVALVRLPANSRVATVGIQGGKDGTLRMVDLANLNGTHVAGAVDGEVDGPIAIPQGGGLYSHPAAWTAPDDRARWVLIGNSNGISGLRIDVDGNGNPSMTPVWNKTPAGTSPLVANNVAYYVTAGSVRAVTPKTGATLWTSPAGQVGSIHWQSPVVGNGMLYVVDGDAHLVAYAPTARAAVRGADFNRDGNTDLLWRNAGSGGVTIWAMNGLSIAGSVPLLGDSTWAVQHVADLNGDGRSDVILRNSSTGQTAIWLMAGLAPSAGAVVMNDANWSVIFATDLNGDGNADLILRNASTGQVVAWLMNGLAIVGGDVLTNDPNETVVGAGDFNGDGRSDLVWHNSSTGRTRIALMDGASALQTAQVMGDPNWSVDKVADFDGNGKSDLAWHNSATGATVIWLMDGLQIQQSANVMGDANWRIAGSADFNNDARADLLWRNASTGATVMWLMDGLSIIAGIPIMGDPTWSVSQIVDLDANGTADLVWTRSTTQASVAWLMNGSAIVGNVPLMSDGTWTGLAVDP